MVSMLDSSLISTHQTATINNSHIYVAPNDSTVGSTMKRQGKHQIVAFGDHATLDNSIINPYAEFAENETQDKKTHLLSDVILEE